MSSVALLAAVALSATPSIQVIPETPVVSSRQCCGLAQAWEEADELFQLALDRASGLDAQVAARNLRQAIHALVEDALDALGVRTSAVVAARNAQAAHVGWAHGAVSLELRNATARRACKYREMIVEHIRERTHGRVDVLISHFPEFV